jgi:hypothetical protein
MLCRRAPSAKREGLRAGVGELTGGRASPIIPAASGCNSVVECQLPKLDVAGSIPVARSTFLALFFALSCRDEAAATRSRPPVR